MSVSIRDRIGAATGAAYVVLIIVGNTLNTAGTSRAAHPTGEQVLADVAHQASSASAKAGLWFEVLGFLAFIAFVGYLIDALRRRQTDRSGFAAAAAVVAAVTMLAIKLGSAGPVIALYMDRDHVSPEIAQVLNDINGAAFVLSWLPFACFALGLGYALLATSMVGRPTAYIGIVCGAAGIVVALIGLTDPPSANPIPFLLSVLWVGVVSVRLAVRPGTGEPQPAQPRPEPMAVSA